MNPPLSPAGCARVGEVLARVGDKWTVLTVDALGDGPARDAGFGVRMRYEPTLTPDHPRGRPSLPVPIR
jgi:DNA-binding HxlR family transcriptional regulator